MTSSPPSDDYPTSSDIESRDRELSLSVRSPLRAQIEALYKEKRDYHHKLQKETAQRKALEKQLKYIEAKSSREAGIIHERWKEEHETRKFEEINVHQLAKENELLKVKIAENNIELSDWKLKYEKARQAIEQEKWSADEVRKILDENRALREQVELVEVQISFMLIREGQVQRLQDGKSEDVRCVGKRKQKVKTKGGKLAERIEQIFGKEIA